MEKMKVDGLGGSGTRSVNVEFPSNSKSAKEEAAAVRKVNKVVTGKVVERKKPLSKKFAELVMGDEGSDMNSVISYVVRDILLPSAKGMLFDIITGGAEMKLFGTTSGKRNRSSSGKTYTSYNSMSSSRSNDRDRDSDRRAAVERNRARHNFDDIVLETRGEADEVLSNLVDLIVDYGVASVADLYALVGITSSFTDNKYGWDDLSRVKPIRVRDGYLLDLPKTKVLD